MKPVALVAACLIGGCASSGGPLEAVQEVVADVVLPPAQEAQLGNRLAAEIEAKEGLHPSAALQRQVAAIGSRLISRGGARAPYDFSFKVVDDRNTVNAFALPGGHVYVTSGLVRLADTEAQLASVVAHEIAHVTERHIAQRLAASYGLQTLVSAALGQDPGLIGQMVGSLAQQGFLLKYSRDQELEADRVGLGYLARAGYDPHAAVAMFRKLAEGGGQAAPAFLSSHPSTERRIEELEESIAQGPQDEP